MGAQYGAAMLTTGPRFVVTHAGSLPRPEHLAALHGRRSRGEAVDPGELRSTVEAATADVVARQAAVGIDVGNDGEQARESFFTYVAHRMTGFGGASRRPVMRDLLEHPDFLALARPRRERMQVDLMHAPPRSVTSPTATRASSTPSARSSPTRRSPRRS